MAKFRGNRNRGRYFRRPEDEYTINERIRFPEVRVVGEGIEEGVMPTKKALELARQKEMDLVLIADKATPPVCRVVDFSKFLYEKKKRKKEIKAKAVKTVLKEIRFGPNTDEHDFQFKLKHAEKFLKEGAKVKAFVHFRGRTIVHKDRGELLLLRFMQELEEFGKPELMPKMEGKRMFVMLASKVKKN